MNPTFPRSFGGLVFLLLLIVDGFLWFEVRSFTTRATPQFYMLDVGQGDSALVRSAGGVKLVIDAGPGRELSRSLEKVLSREERYIDLLMITHPQLDHYGGFIDLLDRYHVGAVLMNGREADQELSPWDILVQKIKDQRIPIVFVGEGDSVRYEELALHVISPNRDWWQSGELNDTGLVSLLDLDQVRFLLTADTGFNVEADLLKRYDLQASVLKVGHHGSHYSTGAALLTEVQPQLAVIGVGENRYGHPHPDLLGRLATVGAKVFRTDQDGTVRIDVSGDRLKVITEHGDNSP